MPRAREPAAIDVQPSGATEEMSNIGSTNGTRVSDPVAVCDGPADADGAAAGDGDALEVAAGSSSYDSAADAAEGRAADARGSAERARRRRALTARLRS